MTSKKHERRIKVTDKTTSLLRTLKQHLLTIIVKYSYNNTIVAGDFQSIIFSQISDRQKFLHENLTFFAKVRIDRICEAEKNIRWHLVFLGAWRWRFWVRGRSRVVRSRAVLRDCGLPSADATDDFDREAKAGFHRVDFCTMKTHNQQSNLHKINN